MDMAVLPVNKRQFIFFLRYLRGNAGRRIPHRVFLGRRSAAHRLLRRVRMANHKCCDAMDSPDGKFLMTRRTFRIEKRGTELITKILGSRTTGGSDGSFGDRECWRRLGRPDRQCPGADTRERTDCGCDNDDSVQRIRHCRQAFSAADRPIQEFHLRRRPLGTAMAATRQGHPASGVELWALRQRRMTTLPGAPFYRLNSYRRAEVAVDPVAGIGLPAREFKS